MAASDTIEKVGEEDADPDSVSMLGLEDDVIDISCEAVAADDLVVGPVVLGFISQIASSSFWAWAVDSC